MTPIDSALAPQHTRGPWKWHLEDDGVVSGVRFPIRMGSCLDRSPGHEPQHLIEYEAPSEEESPVQFAEAEANARLIAAAPDLLAALHYILENCGDPIMENVARAAIAKAEGRSNG